MLGEKEWGRNKKQVALTE